MSSTNGNNNSDNGLSSRDQILGRLRAHTPPFHDARPQPEAYIPVTRFAEGEDPLERFTSEVKQRYGTVHAAASASAAIETVLKLIDTDKIVMAWEALPLPGLRDALAERQIEVVVPQARHDLRLAVLESAEKIRVGITGADAGFATLGTLALVTGKGQGRLPSLLPPVHVALLPRERLYVHLEDWFTEPGRAALRWSSSVALVTGPSSTGDIEHHHVLGAHGPAVLHIVVF